MGNKKPGAPSYTGLFVVDKVIEISNLDLVKSISDIQNLLEYFSKYSLSK
jgi:hypothetical protein